MIGLAIFTGAVLAATGRMLYREWRHSRRYRGRHVRDDGLAIMGYDGHGAPLLEPQTKWLNP